MLSENLVPFRWPVEWKDPAQLKLLAASPINCLLCDATASPVAVAARNAGIAILDAKSLPAAPLAAVKWDAPAAPRVINELVWPRIKMSPGGRRDNAQAGPTGAPWIDSNAWVAHLARVRAKGAPLWLSFAPDKDTPAPDSSAYTTAIADSAAAGARWIVSLDPQLRQGLAAGNEGSLRTWQNMLNMLAFFEHNRKWAAWEPWGALGVLSTFAGEHEFLSHEMLNLSARRNLHYRVLDRAAPPPGKLEQLTAILYVDAAAPTAQWKTALTAFARGGGLLIVPHALASQFPGETAVRPLLPSYSIWSFGRGKVAVAIREWDDPYFLAQDAHSLVSRRNDPVQIFNARSLWEHYSESPDGRAGVLQLVGFSGRPYESVSIRAARPWRSASLHIPRGEGPTSLTPVTVDGKVEYHLPAFSYFAALEFGS